MSACFWCDREVGAGERTRDHVVPRAFGGQDARNVVPACEPCNLERGRLVTFALTVGRAKTIDSYHSYPCVPQRVIDRLFRRLPEFLALRAKWAEIETARWGSSPSAGFDFEVAGVPTPPAVPKTSFEKQAKRRACRQRRKARKRAGEKVPKAVLAEARRVAEARFQHAPNEAPPMTCPRATDPDEREDYTPEPYPVAVKLVDEGPLDRDVCDGDDHPNMTDLIREANRERRDDRD